MPTGWLPFAPEPAGRRCARACLCWRGPTLWGRFCTVPDGVVPVNQDGEVAQFLLLAPDELVACPYRNEFTPEAALVLVAALELSAT